jgi:hypothetical protein
VGGALTGRGADIIIIDDRLKPEEALSQAQRQAANEWYDHTLYSRLSDKLSGAIVLIMHRLHEDDEPREMLEQLRRTVGQYNFSGQYQQAPSPLGGGMIKAGWFKSYSLNERPAACPRRTFPSTSLEARRALHLIGAAGISNSSWQGAPRRERASFAGSSSAYRCAI